MRLTLNGKRFYNLIELELAPENVRRLVEDGDGVLVTIRATSSNGETKTTAYTLDSPLEEGK